MDYEQKQTEKIVSPNLRLTIRHIAILSQKDT